jgi:hypothetical protein
MLLFSGDVFVAANPRSYFLGWAVATVGLGLSFSAAPVRGQVATKVVAISGQAAPDGNGAFDSFQLPSLNNAGDSAFIAKLTGATGAPEDDFGVFRGRGGPLTQIARQGQIAPDGVSVFNSSNILAPFSSITQSDARQVAFSARLTGTAGGSSDDTGVYRGDGGPIVQVAREGETSPDGNGTFSGVGSSRINLAGEVAFFAELRETAGGDSDDAGIYRGDGGSITQIARKGQTAPDGSGAISFFTDVGPLNDAGQVALAAVLDSTGASSAIFRGDGGPLTQVAREGQAAPSGDGNLDSLPLSNLALNNAGQVAFTATMTGASGGIVGVFRGDGGPLTQVARAGQAAPDGNGALSSFPGSVVQNNEGEIVFIASLELGPNRLSLHIGRWPLRYRHREYRP